MTIDAAIREAVEAAVAPLAREIRDLRAKLDPPKEWVTIPEAADHFGKTTATVRRWISEGKLEAKGSGGMRRVRI